MSSSQSPSPNTDPQEPQARASRLPKIMLIVVMLTGITVVSFTLGAQYFGRKAIKSGNSDDRSIRQIIVGNDVVNIPANVFRFKNQREATTSKRLDLFYLWPGFEGYSLARHNLFYGKEANSDNLIFVTIENRKISLDMSARLKAVYSQLLEGTPQDAGFGLVFQRLKPEAGYSGEELFYDQNSPSPYVVRCQREPSAQTSASCMRDKNIGKGLSLTYRFSRDLLANWRAIEATIVNLSTGYLSD